MMVPMTKMTPKFSRFARKRSIRTGSADFSRGLVTYARDKTDYRVDEGYLVHKSLISAGASKCP